MPNQRGASSRRERARKGREEEGQRAGKRAVRAEGDHHEEGSRLEIRGKLGIAIEIDYE